MISTLRVGLPRPHEPVQTPGKRAKRNPEALWVPHWEGMLSHSSTRFVVKKESMPWG